MSNENTAAGLEDGSETTEPTDFHSRLSEDISRAMEECFRSACYRDRCDCCSDPCDGVVCEDHEGGDKNA
ncbi:hypothetical protein Pcinc_003560 [Petrolisthes cinctipes]|nr:hypothetical protein Pcinc_003560 [Petrolisthes cinctipes]